MEAIALVGEALVSALQNSQIATGDDYEDDAGETIDSVAILGQAFETLDLAQQSIEHSYAALANLAHFLDDNWDPKYEAYLVSSGFQGSQFLMAEYARLLEHVQQTMGAARERRELAEEALRTGAVDDLQKDFSPGIYLRMYAVCGAVIELLQFQHRIAQTRYTLLSYQAGQESDYAMAH